MKYIASLQKQRCEGSRNSSLLNPGPQRHNYKRFNLACSARFVN